MLQLEYGLTTPADILLKKKNPFAFLSKVLGLELQPRKRVKPQINN